jgi:3-deoxy-D-manno-octulosonic-acid transferase
MPRTLYSILLSILIPGILLRLLLRSFANPSYRQRIGERFALTNPLSITTAAINEKPLVVIHAVSVGEVMAVTPLVTELLKNQRRVLVTTMTPTGSDTVRSQFGDSVAHCYLPYDLPGTMTRFLNSINPSLIVIMETELWPNLIHTSKRLNIPLVLANARMSERSAKGYARLHSLTTPMLRQIDHIAAQSKQDAQRLISLGADHAKVTITGSLKFNQLIPDSKKTRDSFMQAVLDSARPVIIAASTRDGEESKVLNAFKSVLSKHPSALLVLVPRHLERFDSVAELVKKNQLELVRRTELKLLEASHQVFLGDSMGELMTYYSLAKIAFVGGSLVDTGCQNVLEPAAISLPVIVGPSQFNFAAICDQLEKAGALLTVKDEFGLARALLDLLEDPQRAKDIGHRGAQLVSENQLALPKLMEIIAKIDLH